MRSVIFTVSFILLSIVVVNAQKQSELNWFSQYQETYRAEIMQQYIDFISIPNTTSSQGMLLKNAQFLLKQMQLAGIKQVQLLKLNENIPPVVYGEVKVPGATQTIVFYAHYDGQPADSTNWYKGLHPFIPSFYNYPIQEGGTSLTKEQFIDSLNDDYRIYCRGVADDKAGVMAIIQAYIALKKINIQPKFNIKFFFEGEEEAGSPHLGEVLQQNKLLLQSDIWIICDGPQPFNKKNLISFGVRGDTHMDITLYGSKVPLHSGHYGNWAPNPAWNLIRLLASMKNDSGYVTIKNFYADVQPFSAEDKKLLADLDLNDAKLKQEFGFNHAEMQNVSLSEAIFLPTLNINGIASGNVGKLSTNSIPASASVSLDLRLVPGNDYQKQQQKVLQHIQSKGYYIIDHEPSDHERMAHTHIAKVICGSGYNAQKTPINLPISQKIIQAISTISTNGLMIMPLTGGSLPLFTIEQQLNAKAISIPIANYDDNQHAANENIRIGNFWNGIKEMISIMTMQ
ncbi:MAG: M20/M25/M40 family metallo-hydrolase [Bacteroidota bacterium]|jgi:acetylornithine deacetylase/succinyl-diaminopimelate desuccinylase-like protein|nr:M20/M25/M40 family metallo-hydrolase [Bacteroidota bacterium]